MKRKIVAAIIIRILIIVFVVPNYLNSYYVPFLSGIHLDLDNWSKWLDSGGNVASFPYGLAMLIVYIPSLILSIIFQQLSVDPFRALEIAVGLQMLIIECFFWRYLLKKESMRRSINVFLYSPLIIWVNYFLGLNDFFPSICLFVAAHLLMNHRYRSAGLMMGIAIGMKFSLALVLPFLVLFAWDNPRFKKRFWSTALMSFFTAIFLYLPGLYSEGFRTMVFDNKESLKALGYFLNLDANKILILPLIYVLLLYWLWKAGRISVDVLIAFFGISLLLISAFSPASIGWMLWGLPLMFMNLAKEKKSRVQLVVIQSLFMIHSISAGVEIRLTSSSIQMPTLDDDIRNLIFTLAISLISIWSYSNLKVAIRYGDRYKIANSPITVSIAGDSGTGKDTLARALVEMFTPETSIVLCGDDYHKYERGDESWKKTTHLNPSANHLDLWERDYNLAHNRQYFEQREYDHSTGKFSSLKPRFSRDLLVSQGLHALFPGISSRSDLKIFLSMEDELRVKLKLARDSGARSQSFDSILQNIESRQDDYKLYIDGQKDVADLNFHIFEEDAQIGVKISSRNNVQTEFIVKTLSQVCLLNVEQESGSRIKTIKIISDDVDSINFENLLKENIASYDQLFLMEPSIPEGILGVMSVLSVLLITVKRQGYHV